VSQPLVATPVEVEPEHYIPVSRTQLLDALREQMLDQADAAAFHEVTRLLALVFHAEFHALGERLADAYQQFEGSADHSGVKQAPAEVIAGEHRFLDAFVLVMQRANFLPLTARDIAIAGKESFVFDLPVEIDWSRLDDQLLGRWLAARPEFWGDQQPPDFAQRILLFRRGTGVEKVDGLLLLPKIDLLATRVLEWLLARVGLVRREAELEAVDDGACRVNHSVYAARVVDRVTLKRQRLSLKFFLQRTELQEPTFRQLVMVYRAAAPNGSQRVGGPIRIKVFRDIPMADLEVVFPEKKLSMKPVDLIKLAVTGLIGIVMVAFKILVKGAFNPVLAVVSLVTLVGYGMKIVFGYRQSHVRYQWLVTQSLYDKSLDNDRGVIFYLIDQLERQEVAEAVLAYYFLWQNGPKLAAEIDAVCERFIAARFGHEVDFEIEDALAKLERLGLVARDGDVFRALGVEAALQALRTHWCHIVDPLVANAVLSPASTPVQPLHPASDVPVVEN
jgi:hypothetical protein